MALEEDLVLGITARICQLMEEQSVSRDDLAEELGVRRSHLTALLLGSRDMTLRRVVQIFFRLGKKISFSESDIDFRDFRISEVEPKRKENEMGGKTVKAPSRYGSHASMALDPVLQVLILGYPRCTRRVILRDELGTYVTDLDRLDSGLADPNRYCCRAKGAE